MKTLRYLLIICTLTMAAAMSGQPQFKNSQNEAAFSSQYVPTTHYVANSTSTLMESGSSLPMAARNGLTIGANTPDDNMPAYARSGRPRKDVGGGGSTADDGDEPDLPEEPNPVGDGVWVLLILAAGYAWYRKWRGWRKISCIQS